MKPVNYVKVKVWNSTNNTWSDITNRIVSINTSTGSDLFQGFWDQPDAGQFSIVSRDENVDPNVNALIRTNALIYIYTDLDGDEKPLMYGFINDVNVRYIENDYPEVTINGTDLIGYLNRIVINQDFLDLFTVSFPNHVIPVELLIAYLTQGLDDTIAENFSAAYGARAGYLESPGQAFQASFGFSSPATPTVKLEIGKTVYELLVGGVSSALIQIENQNGNLYRFNPYYNDDPSLYITGNSWAPDIRPFSLYYFKTSPTDTWDDFPDTGPEDNTYKFINVNDGFDRIINQVTINNTNPVDASLTTFPTASDDVSVTKWGPAKLDLYTTFNSDTNSIWKTSATIAEQAAQIEADIFDYQSTPKMSINSITIDMNKQYNHNYYPSYPGNGSEFYIQHKITPTQKIKGYFVVSGVKHSITQDSWFSTYALRDSEYEIYNLNKPKIPTINLSATTGTTATSFTASIGNYTSGELANIDKIEWMVNLPSFFKPTAPPSQLFNLDRSMSSESQAFGISNVPEITGSTATWTYDDNGVLQGYPSSLIGPGFYTVAVWVTDKNGYTSCGWTTAETGGVISITSATAHADFFFSKNTSEQVTFYDASGTDTNTWSWNFGDGTTYNGKTPPPKSYTTSGTYNVTLTVNNGYNTNSVTKPVQINIYTLPVQYVRLRYQGTVTKPAGAEDYPVDLIDTIGLVELVNTSNQQTGGIQPMYVHVRTAEKIQDIYKGNQFKEEKMLDSFTGFTDWLCSDGNPPDPSIGFIEYPVFAAIDPSNVSGETYPAYNGWTYQNGSNGIGATITYQNPITNIDGIPVEPESTEIVPILVLSTWMTSGTNTWISGVNGVYWFDPQTPNVLTRVEDFDELAEINQDIYFSIFAGNKSWAPYISGSGNPTDWTIVRNGATLTPNTAIGIGDNLTLRYEPWILMGPPFESFYTNVHFEGVVNHTDYFFEPGLGPYNPYYTTNYNSAGPLDPMSQTMKTAWNAATVRGTIGGDKAKYKFHPVITNNPDGSQTKSIDVDLIIWYSQAYTVGSSTTSSSSVYRDWYFKTPAALNPNRIPYLPGGRPASLQYWTNWGGSGTGFGERYKLNQIKIWPGKDQIISEGDGGLGGWYYAASADGNCTTNTVRIGHSGYAEPYKDRYGIQTGKTYLPISISVSEDGVTYRKVGEANYVSGNTMTTTYTTTMPALNTAPIEA